MIVKMIKNLENKMEKMQESINKYLEELKNKHIEPNNTITEIKNTLEGIREGNGTPLQYSCWKIPWTEEPGRLQSMRSLRVRHD